MGNRANSGKCAVGEETKPVVSVPAQIVFTPKSRMGAREIEALLENPKFTIAGMPGVEFEVKLL